MWVLTLATFLQLTLIRAQIKMGTHNACTISPLINDLWDQINPLLLPTTRWKAAWLSPVVLMSHPPPPGPLNPWVCPQEGMLQHWELGQALRQRYHGFVNASYHRQEVRLGTREAIFTLCPQGDYQ